MIQRNEQLCRFIIREGKCYWAGFQLKICASKIWKMEIPPSFIKWLLSLHTPPPFIVISYCVTNIIRLCQTKSVIFIREYLLIIIVFVHSFILQAFKTSFEEKKLCWHKIMLIFLLPSPFLKHYNFNQICQYFWRFMFYVL